MEGLPMALREMVEDYRLHLVDIRRLENTDIFKTDVKQVFDFIRCSGDKRKLLELVQGDAHFREMEEDAYEVVTNYVRAEELIQVKEECSREDGKIDMCQALKELLADERMEGLAEGQILGHAGAIKGVIVKMVQKGKSDKEIMELTECSAQMLWEVEAELKSRVKS